MAKTEDVVIVGTKVWAADAAGDWAHKAAKGYAAEFLSADEGDRARMLANLENGSRQMTGASRDACRFALEILEAEVLQAA
jgi:hypothetical protein